MTTIKFRRDTSSNWTSVNPIPAQGEPCYETDTGKLKIGNGSDNYVTLPYVSDGGGSAGGANIDDSTTATTSVWSSSKTNTEITTVANEVVQVQGDVASLDGDVSTLKTDVSGLKTDVSGLKTDVSGLKTDVSGLKTDVSGLKTSKQNTLVSGTNIKTINGETILGEGDITVGGSTGTTDYTQLENKPQINSVELTGNKTLNDLGIQPKGNYLTALPDNAVTTDTDQTIEGVKTFTQDITAPNIKTTANGTIKLAHPTNATGGLMTISNNYGQLSVSTISDGNNLLSVARGTLYVTIDADKIVTKDASGNFRNYINSQNIDTTYMKWDSTSKKLKVDTAAVAHLAMPSSTKVDLTLGASGTTYTAPADGYVCVGFFGNVGGNFEILAQVSNSVSYVTGAARCQCPVLKGEFSCWYENVLNDNSLVFCFNYAIGTVPTNT